MIEVSHLTKRYGNHCAVDDISFTVDDGCIYGLLGPNGAGKSTTMNVITGYLSATSGTVKIDGHDIMEEPREAKSCIGYLPEQPPLYVDMTVREYLMFVAELKGVRPKAARLESIELASGRTGLENMQNRLIRNLSKGYRQRVGIAATLLGDPKVIILDEPTVGLDPAQMIEIRSLIHDLSKTHTVILSSHILSEVQAVCDQVLIIAHGKLVAQGTPEELAGRLAARGVIAATALGGRDAVLNALNQIDGLANIQITAEKGNEVSFTASSEAGSDLRAALSKALADAGCPVLSLTSQTMSLEDVFLQLTETAPEAVSGQTKASAGDGSTEVSGEGADSVKEPDASAPAESGAGSSGQGEAAAALSEDGKPGNDGTDSGSESAAESSDAAGKEGEQS